VNLLSTSAARGLRFPLVIIPGLDEGRFPAKLRQDPLLLDAERLSMGTLPVKSRRADEEKLLFDMAARSAEKRLVLMTSRLDEASDRERIPSQFFLRAASAVCGSALTTRDLTQGVIAGFRSVSLDNPAPAKDEIAIDEGEVRLRMVSATRDLSASAIKVLAELEPSRIRRPLQYDRSRWESRLTAFDGLITDPTLVRWTAQRLGISAGQVSASRLEEYMKCPYYFFLKRAMELQGWEEQGRVEGMDPLKRGTAIHLVLEDFLREIGGGDFRVAGDGLWKTLESQARQILDAAKPAGLADLLWEVERDALLRMLKGWLEFEALRANSEMHVDRLEQIFGEFEGEEKFPAFCVEAGRHAFSFRGRIDRVDLSSDCKHARVVDYKTGALPESMAKKIGRTPLMSGEKIQLLIYAGALSLLEEFSGVETIEAEYLHLQPKNGLTVPCSFSNEELQQARESLPKILELAGNGIEAGVFFAKTSGKVRPTGHCDYCSYLPVCGKDRIRREERKAKDPRVRLFVETVEPL
jgi:ATP-dependent helicase/DNAse subunit B